jgi:hypothetical protein
VAEEFVQGRVAARLGVGLDEVDHDVDVGIAVAGVALVKPRFALLPGGACIRLLATQPWTPFVRLTASGCVRVSRPVLSADLSGIAAIGSGRSGQNIRV